MYETSAYALFTSCEFPLSLRSSEKRHEVIIHSQTSVENYYYIIVFTTRTIKSKKNMYAAGWNNSRRLEHPEQKLQKDFLICMAWTRTKI